MWACNRSCYLGGAWAAAGRHEVQLCGHGMSEVTGFIARTLEHRVASRAFNYGKEARYEVCNRAHEGDNRGAASVVNCLGKWLEQKRVCRHDEVATMVVLAYKGGRYEKELRVRERERRSDVAAKVAKHSAIAYEERSLNVFD
ncbi:unnamed protein product [Dovyalis caffra]|uniref:Uncharacterized protein n=1 Tax=Dovyalis caffra TaxID=77055 RepID=A0AAV1RU70_9ROSI|nr:unnamed protein product [Dovyalis caffra]